MFYNSTTTIIAEFLGNKTWVDPPIVEANHRYWYCAACALVLVLWRCQDVEQTPHTPSGQIGGKIRHADVGWLPALVGSLEFPT